MNSEKKDTYFVAVKIFFEKDGKLLILKDNFGDWDLPGGRIKKDEFNTPLEEIIERKVKEELGNDIKYLIGDPLVFMRHERIEQTQGRPVVRIFAIGYKGFMNGGDIKLSARHTKMLWVGLDDFDPAEYFAGGWLKGVREYLNLRKKTN